MFVHLRLHTEFSVVDGTNRIDDIVKAAAADGQPALAITDLNNLFGAIKFYKEARARGVKPLIGCELMVQGLGSDAAALGRMVVQVQSRQGYLNLCELLARAWTRNVVKAQAAVTFAWLQELGEGLILLAGAQAGPVGQALVQGDDGKAREIALQLAGAFPHRFYVELQRAGRADDERHVAAAVQLAARLNLPVVATHPVQFTGQDDYEAHEARVCISEGEILGNPRRVRKFTREQWFKPSAQMEQLFADVPSAVANTLEVAKRCNLTLELGKPRLPNFPTPNGMPAEEYFRFASHQGLKERLEHLYPDPAERERQRPRYEERLEFELATILKMGFPGYFLIVGDFINWAKDHGCPVGPGRGSGAGSVVAWALTITDLDPLRFGLLFERFLNPERVSMPDFDIDFCQDRRDEVIRYVQQEYGRDRVAQIITFGKLQARAVLRNVGRVLEMPLGYVDKICKMVPMNPAAPVLLKEAIEQEPELQNLRDTDDSVKQLLDISLKLEGLYAHASTHAAGLVIGDRPLDELVPLYRDPNSDMPVTQFNMKWVEPAGLVKFDFLGLKTLTVLERAVNLLKARGIDLDLAALPLDDKPTFAMLTRGDSFGIFQFEGSGMRDVMRKLKPDVFEDLIAINALYRPGPMDNIDSFVNRKHGREPIDYMHPALEPILKETYGIIVYQEQVMQAAQLLAGYSLGGADLLRRAMGKKIKSEMDAQREIFIKGASARQIASDRASSIFDTIDKFAGYGFNKSHAAAYALVAYQTAYLKANYPVEFMAASMTLDMHNTDKLSSFKGELDRLKISLLPPDVNKSDVAFAVEGKSIRYALAAIKNVGVGAMEMLVKARERGGAFKNIFDFANRLDTSIINKRLMENLVRAGALDCLEPNRAALMEGVETILRHAQSSAQDRVSKQVSLFGGEQKAQQFSLPKVPDWRPMEKLSHEFDAIGFYLSAHPLDAYSGTLESLRVIKARDLESLTAHDCTQPIKMAGTLVTKRERVNKRGNKYAFVMLSDDTGTFEVTMFSEVLATARDLLEAGTPMLLTLEAQLEAEKVRLLVTRVDSLEKAIAAKVRNLKLRVDTALPVDELRQLMMEDGRGKSRIVVVTRSNGHEVEVSLPGTYAIQPKTLSGLKNIPGIAEIREF